MLMWALMDFYMRFIRSIARRHLLKTLFGGGWKPDNRYKPENNNTQPES